MVDSEPDYRPRRAFVEPGPTPDPTPAPPAAARPDERDPADEDLPKPLYRDEVAGDASTPRSAPDETADPPTSATTAVSAKPARPITFTPRRTRSADDDATTILPRVGSGRHGEDPDAIDDLSDDERGPMGQRTKLALWIGAAVAVAVVGLAIGYAVLGVGNTPTTGTTPVPSIASSTDPSAATPQPTAELLGDDTLLSTKDAGLVASTTWKVASTERGTSEDSPTPACFGPDPVEGQPLPQQRALRLLSSSGKNAPGLLHEATAYATPEEAAQAYAVAAKTLGGCEVAGSYLVSGQSVTGIGDQAVGVVVSSVSDTVASNHTVVLSRTGRVLNLLDAAHPDQVIAPNSVAKAAAAVVSRECEAAGGGCGGAVAVKDGPPPIGGDELGFLATGDLPPAGKTPRPWVATPPELPKETFFGSQCETVTWSTLATEATTSRVYIVQDSGNFFGLNDIVVTMKDENAAKKLVDKVRSDLDSCEKRKLTAKVSKPEKVSGPGARKSEVAGYTAKVSQRLTDETLDYRVGIVSAGTKVAYTFLNPQDDFSFTDDEWDTVAVRAGQRATQVN